MSYSHRSPKHLNTGTLTIAVLPLCIYFLQLAGKFSSLAAIAAGVLIILKIAIEWCNYRQRVQHRSSVRRIGSRPASATPISSLVAPCYLCNRVQPLHAYTLDQHHVGICRKCHHCLNFTDHH